MIERAAFKATPEAQCDGKDPLTFDVAKKLAAKRPGLVAYRCPHCRRWHVGHGTKGTEQ